METMLHQYIIAFSVTASIHFLLAVILLLTARGNCTTIVFSWYALAVVWWSALEAVAIGTRSSEFALHLFRIYHIGVTFIPVFFAHFVYTLASAKEQIKYKWLLRGLYGWGLGWSIAVLTPFFIEEVVTKLSYRQMANPGFLYPIFIISWVAIAVCLLVKLYLIYRVLGSEKRHRLLYFPWSMGLAYLGGAPNFLPVFNVEIAYLMPYGIYLIPVHGLLTIYGLFRHQLLIIPIVIRKSIVYSVLIAIITATYLVAVLIAEKAFQGFLGYRSFLTTTFVAFLIAIFFNPLRYRIQTLVDRALFKGTADELADQREQLLVEIRRGEQMKAVGTFAAGLAHEIKNPLASIKIFTEYLDKNYADETFRRKFQKIVGGEIEKINVIVQQLLDFSKPVPPKLELLELPRLLDETLQFLNSELVQHHVEVKTRYEWSGRILGDSHQLRQVFLNLFLNSLQAMNGNGQLDVRTRANGNELEITISDSGSGIDPKDVERIFEPFFTRKMNGTGLGLAVVRSIVNEHRGRVEAESHPGQGACFKIYLPLAAKV